MLAAGVKSTAAHAQAPTDTNPQVLRTLGGTKSNGFSPQMGARKEITLKRQTILAWLFCVVALLPIAEAANQTYGFNLVGPQLTSAASGASVRTTGSGSFDPVAQTVISSGSFAQFNADGSVAARGTWVATGFVSFIAFGGPNPGLQGGVLQITVTLFFQGGEQQTDVPMTITCLINAPPGFTGDEGITLGVFTHSIEVGHSHTLFHLNL